MGTHCAHFAPNTSIDTDGYTYGKECANPYFLAILHPFYNNHVYPY